MAQKGLAIPSKELLPVIVGPVDYSPVARVQRISVNADIPNTDVDELGNSQHAGTSKDVPNVTVSFSVMDTSIKLFALLTGNDATAYPGAGVDIDQLSEIDVILYVKDPNASQYVKAIHGRRLQVRDFTFSYSLDGDSTEDYTAIGSKRRYFSNEVVVDKFTTGTTSFTLSQTPLALQNGDKLLSVILDGVYLTEVASGPATGQYSVSGTTLTTYDSMSGTCLVVYHTSGHAETWSYVSDTDVPASIRGKNADVIISALDIPRVQSVTINGTLNVQPVREMGNVDVVGYQRQVPSVTGTITVLDTDTELVNIFENGELTTSGVAEWTPGEGCVSSGVPLKIQLLDCDDAVVLKTIYIPELTITSDAFTSTVNGNATSTYNFKSETAQCLVFSGEY